MNSLFPHLWSVRSAIQVSAVASLLVLSACAHGVTSRSSPESQLIAAVDLPAGSKAPQLVRGVAPVFPDELKRAGIEGEVRLLCLIGEKGEVRHIASDGPSHAQFVASAKRALQAWKFEPGWCNGQPAAMSIMIPIRFVLVDTDAGRESRVAFAAAR